MDPDETVSACDSTSRTAGEGSRPITRQPYLIAIPITLRQGAGGWLCARIVLPLGAAAARPARARGESA